MFRKKKVFCIDCLFSEGVNLEYGSGWCNSRVYKKLSYVSNTEIEKGIQHCESVNREGDCPDFEPKEK